MAIGDPDSEAARRTVRCWQALTEGMKRPPAPAGQAWAAMVARVMANPALGPRPPVDPEVLAFVKRVANGMKKPGEGQAEP